MAFSTNDETTCGKHLVGTRPRRVRGRLVESSLPVREPEYDDLEGLGLRFKDDVAVFSGMHGH
jgi:hypothetical protein